MSQNIRPGEHVVLCRGGMCRWVQVQFSRERNGRTVLGYTEINQFGRSKIHEVELNDRIYIDWSA